MNFDTRHLLRALLALGFTLSTGAMQEPTHDRKSYQRCPSVVPADTLQVHRSSEDDGVATGGGAGRAVVLAEVGIQAPLPCERFEATKRVVDKEREKVLDQCCFRAVGSAFCLAPSVPAGVLLFAGVDAASCGTIAGGAGLLSAGILWLGGVQACTRISCRNGGGECDDRLARSYAESVCCELEKHEFSELCKHDLEYCRSVLQIARGEFPPACCMSKRGEERNADLFVRLEAMSRLVEQEQVRRGNTALME